MAYKFKNAWRTGNGQVLTSINGLLTVDYYLAYLDIAIDESQAKIKAANN